jgi:HSP20 family protein
MVEKKQERPRSTEQQDVGVERTGGQRTRETAIERGGEQRLGGYGGRYASAASPFALVRRMMEDMDRLFFGGFGDLTGPSGFEGELYRRAPEALATTRIWSPQVEVMEKDGELLVRADLPGLNEDDVQVELGDDGLTISGERRSEREEERQGVYHSERNYGSFQRRIALPRGVDPNTCDAKFENGVLEVKMKLPASVSRTVQIRGAGQPATSPTQNQPKAAPSEASGQNPGQPLQNGPASPPHH